jgi:hypothetical protein
MQRSWSDKDITDREALLLTPDRTFPVLQIATFADQ